VTAIERILAQLPTLTPEEREILRAFLLYEPPIGSVPKNDKKAKQIMGKYSFVPTSSEAFASTKNVEIQLEQRHNE